MRRGDPESCEISTPFNYVSVYARLTIAHPENKGPRRSGGSCVLVQVQARILHQVGVGYFDQIAQQA